MSGCENGLTTDPKHEDLGHGADDKPVPQNKCYLVLSEEERAKGFVRPVRSSYVHVGIAGPQFPLQDITAEQKEIWKDDADPFVKFEPYPAGHKGSSTGRYWTEKDLDRVGKGCGTLTTMGRALAETYARNPGFYGSTYCCGCHMHRPVGADGEFVWDGTDERVGT
jgi:hypothetical protein